MARSNKRQQEEVKSGGVAWRVYGNLFLHSMPLLLGVAFFALFVSPLIALFTNLLLASW